MPWLSLTLVLLQTPAPPSSLSAAIAARIAQTPARAVGVYYRDLTTGDSLTVGSDVRFHAASTMKIPVMIQLFRVRVAGLLSLDDSITVTNTFHSIVDSSPYQLDVSDDSDSSLYKRAGGGQRASIRELIELMETVSSNLATNLLIAKVDAKRANATAHALGADSILVLRGVEDGKAYRAGLNNTGWIGQVVYHDAAFVQPPGGGRGYVLVVLTGGIPKDDDAHALARDVSKLVFDAWRKR